MRYSEKITHSTAPGKTFFLVVFFILLLAISAFSQSREEKKLRIQAVKSLNSGNFKQAQNIYTDLLKLDPNNPDYNYEMGLAIYEEKVNRGKAAPYFSLAIQNTLSDTLPDMFLFAGKAEQFAGNFEIAIQYFKTYMKLMRDRDGLAPNELDEDIPRYIEMCQNGKVQFENNKQYIRIDNMGKEINSVYADYAPVVSKNENIILFTSRRDNTTGGDVDSDEKYFEDIYYSLNVNGSWTKATNYDSTKRYMNDQVNTDDHDAVITFAADETQLYIYREEDVWISKLENGMWTVPVRDDGRINSQRGFEPSVFITDDQKTMFVVSELSSGYGGRDIYMTTKQIDGTWKPLKTLGKVINTKFDEDAPYLTPDGNTLYFASNGHNSMGDYDIFKSVLDEKGNWTAPENLGPPINTPGHDRYFVTTDEGAVGYYASDRDGGYGETDIYRIILDCKAVSATIIRGVVFSEDRNAPTAASITIFDATTNRVINTYQADAKTGKYEMRLKTETDYRFKIEADGYMPHMGDFSVPKQCDYYSLFQEIKIDNVEDSAGRIMAQRATINNAFFDIDSKIEDDFAHDSPTKRTEEDLDSLRVLIAATYNPVEITNYVKTIDILDPNGVRLATEIVGGADVATIQARDEVKRLFNKNVVTGDQHYYNNNLPEARANYVIAKTIDEKAAYPDQQINNIDKKLKDQPQSAFLATLAEVDSSQMVEFSFEPEDESEIIAEWDGIDTTRDEVTAMNEETTQPVDEVEASQPTSEVPNEALIAEDSPEPHNEGTAEITEESSDVSEIATESVESAEQPESQKENQSPTESPAEEIAQQTAPTQMEKPIAEAKPTQDEPASSSAKAEEKIVFRNILFDFDRSELRQESIRELNKITDYMETKTSVELRIDGHADWIGTPAYNLALSEKRAKTAHDFLVDNGITEGRLTYQYFGEAVPIAPNANQDGSDNPEGRQLNRRCEFKVDQAGTAQNVTLKF